MKLHSFIKYNKIYIVLIQEHNVKSLSTLDYLTKYFKITLNPTINIKGGTAIMIDRKLDIDICNTYVHPSSRLCKATLNIQNYVFDIFCVYAHSGAKCNNDREEFFENELLSLIRSNPNKVVIGGDWNCLVCDKDSSHPKNSCFSNSLKQIVNSLKLTDIHNQVSRLPQYTFIKANYASRLDRIYIDNTVSANARNTNTVAVSFSDHSCFMFDLKPDNIFNTGISYWKLNCSILKEPGVKDDFKVLWEELVKGKSRYRTILEWWEKLVKIKVKTFYIDVCRMKKNLRYNMLNVLESRLRYLYETSYQSGIPNIVEIQNIKKKIETIRDEMAEGIKIRTRMQDLQNGEKISKYVINKQREVTSKKIMSCLYDEDGNDLKSFPAIQEYVTKFYADLYKSRPGCLNMQENFLSFLNCKLDDHDRELLCEEFTKCEIYKTVQSFAKNRTPGVDGLPVEFYLENWDVIGNEFTCLVRFITQNKVMSNSQHKGVITIIKKDGNGKDLKNWRPISLLCVDYKIVAKLLAKRIQFVLDKVIDPNQFCSVPGRSIVHCNMLIRDIVYYVNSNDKESAILKLDWHKAFDLVDVNFLMKILNRLGFGDDFISMINMLYTDIESAMSINNCIGRYFPVTRSVRQGCPLSMILYILYQEPFYAALRSNPAVHPLVLPDHSTIKAIGYADDTTIIISSVESLVEVEKVVREFEIATNSKINRNDKSKIFGMGKWKEKCDWPLEWLKCDNSALFTLGIFHCNSYPNTLNANWDNIVKKIEAHTRLLLSRRLTLFQRAAYVNSCILSKLWYIAHIYPLSPSYGLLIQRAVFKYLWGGRYEPIKRVTVCMEKKYGGLGVFDCITKAKAIIVNSFLKSYIGERGDQSLMLYYCKMRMDRFVARESSLLFVFSCPSPYYSFILDFVAKSAQFPNFPLFNNKALYRQFGNQKDLTVEKKYPLFDWNLIWSNFHSSHMNIYEKDVIYKHLHDVLALKKRLYMLNLSENNLCDICDMEENAVHLFYSCCRVRSVFNWLLAFIELTCNFKPNSNIKFLYFDFKIEEMTCRNTCIMLLYSYITAVWSCRNNCQLTSDLVKEIVKAKIIKLKRDLTLTHGNVVNKYFGDYLEKIDL